MSVLRVHTPVGRLTARWSQVGLHAIEFSEAATSQSDTEQRDEAATSSFRVSQNQRAGSWGHHERLFEEWLAAYFSGNQVTDSCLSELLEGLDWNGVPEFHRQVLEHCTRIPVGQTRTYGQLAAEVGRPKAARAVGSAMARNRWPILIPCHRVVGASGKLCGYSGYGGLATKRKLLELETFAALGDPVSP